MPDILSAVAVATEFRQELALLDAASVETMLDAWRGVEARLLADMETFAARFTAGQALTPGRLLRMERYQALYVQVEAQLAAMESAAGPILTAGQMQAAQQGALAAATTLRSLGVAASFNALPTPAVENVIALARAGRPLAALLEPMYGLAADGIIRELVQGVALGLGPRQIARRMAQDGLTDALDHLLLVTRDQYNRAHRTAALQRYEASGVVRGYVRRCARQAGRTCIACIALDGEFYPLSEPFEEHPQGRCTPIPAVEGVDMRPLTSGRAWFEGLSQDEQIATMGRGRWEAWGEGRMPWDSMVRRTEHPVWGVSVTPAPIGRAVTASARQVSSITNSFVIKKMSPEMRARMEAGIEAINSVHGVNGLPIIELVSDTAGARQGAYWSERGVAQRISISKKYGQQDFTFLHEAGHFIDQQVMGGRGGFGSVANKELFGEWKAAILKSRAVDDIKNGGLRSKAAIDYLLSTEELWARSYAQYITKRSGSDKLLASLDFQRKHKVKGSQWDDDDFESIATAIDGIFRSLGWLR